MTLLCDGEIDLVGRLREASNQTFAIRLRDETSEQLGIYKPISGEAPLWDFPDGTLAHREYAAYLVSEALGWQIVPPTVLRDGPAGRGMVQEWIAADDQQPVRIVRRGDEGDALQVLDAEDQWGRPVTLIHEDTDELRRIALFDLLINNTDRKGSHVLPEGTHRWGIDHGVCFHVDDKVRTVLWGWAGTALRPDEREAMEALASDEDLAASLAGYLSVEEVEAFRMRVGRLLDQNVLPLPRADWPPIPWPPL